MFYLTYEWSVPLDDFSGNTVAGQKAQMLKYASGIDK